MKALKGIGYAAVSSATFGLTPFFSVWLLRAGLSPSELLTYRWGLAALALWLYGCSKGIRFRVSRREVVPLIGLTFLRAATSFTLVIAYANIASGTAATIHFIYPLVVALVLWLCFGEKQSWVFFVALLLSLIGVALLSEHSMIGGASASIGIGMALVSVGTYAIYMIGVQKTPVAQMDSTVLTTYVMAGGALLFGLLSTTGGGVQLLDSWTEWLAALGLAIPATALSNFALVRAIHYIGSGKTAALGALEPLVAILMGVLVLHESFGWLNAIGVVLIVVSVTIVVWIQQRE